MTHDRYAEFTRAYFRGWSGAYDLFALPVGYAYAAAVRETGAERGRRILDACAGTGEIARRLSRRGAEVVAIDFTMEMLARAARKCGEAVRPVVCDARRLPFADRSFDAAVLSFALHDMPRRVRSEVLREVARTTREGIVILDYRVRADGVWPRILATFETPYFGAFAREGVEEAIRAAGLPPPLRRKLPGPFGIWRVAP
ncbi:MAG TPA: methyltransferase domain-containing protein [Candidatus Polarisedimenticolaceae bacterium]